VDQERQAERTVTFRMPMVALLAVPAGLALAGLGLLDIASERHSAPVGSAGFYLIFLAVAMLALNCTLRVQLNPAGVRIRVGWRSRLIGWSEIRAITVAPYHRSGRRVILWTASGRQVRLPLPMANRAWGDAAFQDGYHRIGQRWLASQAVRPGPAPAYPWSQR
jgi:hypothetical protein